jgi:hypothetical protein
MATKTAPAIDSPSPADIDRCVYLLAKEREQKPERDELAKLKAKFQQHCEARPADLPVRLTGHLYYLDLTARELRREITDRPKALALLRKAMGLDGLLSKLTIPFKLLDAEIPADKQTGFVTSERTGSRDVSGGLLQTPVAA